MTAVVIALVRGRVHMIERARKPDFAEKEEQKWETRAARKTRKSKSNSRSRNINKGSRTSTTTRRPRSLQEHRKVHSCARRAGLINLRRSRFCNCGSMKQGEQR